MIRSCDKRTDHEYAASHLGHFHHSCQASPIPAMVGLSSGQMIAFLAWELAFLILIGLVVGTSFGIWVSELFIPYLQVGADATAQTPPFIVEIAWPAIVRIYTLFGLLFVVALLGLTALLMRMKIFQAIKLGETG